jgi:hypothetical protein
MAETARTITVEARVVGQRRPLISGRQVALPQPPSPASSGHDSLRLRDILTLVVRQEVQAFHSRQEERRLTHVLSPQQIQDGAAAGKIAAGGPQDDFAIAAPKVGEDAAVATALQAFADGLYFVFLDDIQQHDLDAYVLLRPSSALTFIRLVALAGG